MADIFISYARSDRPRAKALAEVLQELGYEVWWDLEIVPGERFSKVIDKELEEAKCVIVLWSKISVESDWHCANLSPISFMPSIRIISLVEAIATTHVIKVLTTASIFISSPTILIASSISCRRGLSAITPIPVTVSLNPATSEDTLGEWRATIDS